MSHSSTVELRIAARPAGSRSKVSEHTSQFAQDTIRGLAIAPVARPSASTQNHRTRDASLHQLAKSSRMGSTRSTLSATFASS